jgi:hypothetical protein
MSFKLQGFFIFWAALFFVSSAAAVLRELYTNASESLYEVVQNKSCSDLSKEDVDKLEGRGACLECLKENSKSKMSTKDFNAIVEESYFQRAAEQELHNLTCSIERVELAKNDKFLKSKIKEDILAKLPSLSVLFKELTHARGDFIRERDKANFIRSTAFAPKGNPKVYEEALKVVSEKEQKMLKLHSSLEATLNSIWMGNTQAAREFLSDFFKSDFSGTPSQSKKFEESFDSYFGNIKTELSDNKLYLEKQGTEKGGILFFNDLDLKTRSNFVKNPYYLELFSKATSSTPRATAALQCHLDAKYGKGNDYLNASVTAATLVLSGGAALFAKVPVIVEATIGSATRLGQISLQTSRVLLAAAAGAGTQQFLEEFDRNCHELEQKSLTSKDICSLPPKDFAAGELQSLEESNCGLAIALSGAPLIVVQKLSAKLKSAMRTARAENLKASMLEKALQIRSTSKIGPWASGGAQDFRKVVTENIQKMSPTYIRSIRQKHPQIKFLEEMGYRFEVKGDVLSVDVPPLEQVARKIQERMEDLVKSGRLKPDEILEPARAYSRKRFGKEEFVFVRFGEAPPEGFKPFDRGILPDGQFERAVAEGKFVLGEPVNDLLGLKISVVEHDLGHISGFLDHPEFMAAYRKAYTEIAMRGQFENMAQQQRFFHTGEFYEYMSPSKKPTFQSLLREHHLNYVAESEDFITVKEVRSQLKNKSNEEMKDLLKKLEEGHYTEPVGGTPRDLVTDEYVRANPRPAFLETPSGIAERYNRLTSSPDVEQTRRALADALTHIHNSQFMDPVTAIREAAKPKISTTDKSYLYYCKSGVLRYAQIHNVFCGGYRSLRLPPKIPQPQFD